MYTELNLSKESEKINASDCHEIHGATSGWKAIRRTNEATIIELRREASETATKQPGREQKSSGENGKHGTIAVEDNEAGGEPEQPPQESSSAGEATVTDTEGNTVTLSVGIQNSAKSVTSKDGVSVTLPMATVQEVVRIDIGTLAVRLKDGSEFRGDIEYNVTGKSDLGEYSLPWSKVEHFRVLPGDFEAPQFKPPGGLTGTVELAAGGQLELQGLLYGFTTSRPDDRWSPPRVISSDRKSNYLAIRQKSGVLYVIPLALVRSLENLQSKAERDEAIVEIKLESKTGEDVALKGYLAASWDTFHEHPYGHSHYLMGCDRRGTWRVPLAAVKRVTAIAPKVAYPVARPGRFSYFPSYGLFSGNISHTDASWLEPFCSKHEGDVGYFAGLKFTCKVTLDDKSSYTLSVSKFALPSVYFYCSTLMTHTTICNSRRYLR